MGYQVQGNCFETKEAANAAFFGQVVPVIDSGGNLVYPVFKSGYYEFKGEVLDGSYQDCSLIDTFADGGLVGTTLMLGFLSVYMIRILYRFFD